MPSRVFVGNLPYDATEGEIREHFSEVAPVSRVFMPLDRETGRPRGFAFVEFAEDAHASSAIQQLHQKPFKDRPLVVNEARPSEGRPSGGFRPGGASGGGSAPYRPQSRPGFRWAASRRRRPQQFRSLTFPPPWRQAPFLGGGAEEGADSRGAPRTDVWRERRYR